MIRYSLALLAALAFNLSANAAPIKALFLGYDVSVGDAFTDILGSDPRFDLANSGFLSDDTATFVPSLATLQQYDAVLVWANFSPAPGLGDRLADYADGGGRVVLATFLGQYATFGAFDGRINTPGYNPFNTPDFNAYLSVNLGTYNASSPLFAGVNSLSSSQYNGDWLGVDPGATLVASWDNGRPLAGVNANGNVLNISLFPNITTFGGATGDYQQLFRNALAFNAQAAEVPEPATLAVFGGIAVAGALGYRRRKATAAV